MASSSGILVRFSSNISGRSHICWFEVLHKYMPNEFKSLKLSLIFTIPLFVSIAVHYVTILVSRAVTLRYHHLALIANFLNSDTIGELEEFEAKSHTNTIKRRTYIGMFTILKTVQNVATFIFIVNTNLFIYLII